MYKIYLKLFMVPLMMAGVSTRNVGAFQTFTQLNPEIIMHQRWRISRKGTMKTCKGCLLFMMVKSDDCKFDMVC